MKCKSNGNRFILAAEQQNQQSTKLLEVSKELDAVKKAYIDTSSKYTREAENANQLSSKLQQAEEKNQHYDCKMRELSNEIQRLTIINNDLQAQVTNLNRNNMTANESAMDTEQTPSSSTLQAYNAAICDSINNSLAAFVTRIENSLANQYRSLVEELNIDDSRKRKTPQNMNDVNIGGASVLNTTNSSIFPPNANVQTSNELEPPQEKIKPKQFRSTYEIYISKFKNDTTADKIAQHVISKSTVKDRDLFSVELMTKEKVKKLSYVSFKIVTCSENAYEAILKEDVWAPNFTAVPFSKQKPQTKNGNENKKKQSQLQTPIRNNPRRSEKSGASARNRRVIFDENNRNGNASQQSVTPRSSRVNRTVFSGNRTPLVNLQPGNTFAARMHGNVLQQPAFFGIPGQTHNVLQPLYYPVQQQQMFQQPSTYQQQQHQRAPVYQHQQQQRPYQ